MAPPPVRIGRLDVFLLDRLAGSLEYVSRGNAMRFAYDPRYVSEPDALPLSFSMPLRTEPYGTERTTEFFANLLPPESVRRKLGPALHLSRHNVFGFLEALGADCAGAVSLRAPGDAPPGPDEVRLLPLDGARLAEILAALPQRPLFAAGVEGYRISGAGAQDKLVVRMDADGHIFLPLFGTPSTHILKPPLRDWPDSVHNECFAMTLAARLGLDAAPCGILDAGGTPCYWTARFDRERDEDGRVRRLHQEDFCQALGIDGERKYESEGGPSFASVLGAMRAMRLGLRHELRFVDRTLFHVLVGNADAHGKNAGVLYQDRKAGLAPLYDALCTAVYPGLSREPAMSVGGAKSLDAVDRAAVARMAQGAGIAPALALRRLDALVAAIGPAAAGLRDELAANRPSPVYDRIVRFIEKQCDRLRG